jgi:hypothetical protein
MHTHTSMQMCVHAHAVLPHLYLRKKGTNYQEGGGQYPLLLSVTTKNNKPLKCQKGK